MQHCNVSMQFDVLGISRTLLGDGYFGKYSVVQGIRPADAYIPTVCRPSSSQRLGCGTLCCQVCGNMRPFLVVHWWSDRSCLTGLWCKKSEQPQHCRPGAEMIMIFLGQTQLVGSVVTHRYMHNVQAGKPRL